ncbi:23S ribosomal RNA methyltransferase Erm [Actinoalloteichus hymeniacidonis]|uniref:Dimethyladenosine transferase (rRNA methylation) n=1 Tax=Actinoalloteichus hymeniacidonis TaxID=340345 RepID=A0AAC9HM20_9PSEU|nr:23S ribosomal RNA methyltransferase Erm [Actinoalloteichus hymeniacidonis]AOS61688.1 dimethyladenosine transferase (rRNA methylation) [Actinoalloteichus hymeniacidonis]MBB5910297.1 23S rRNA (adenine-N6)-dimethyltransferase [Actinoalloteichus hymeniacidonis]
MSKNHPRLPGRHELGQNHLVDKRVPTRIAELLREETPGPILEYGAGDGALTSALLTTGRDLTAIEIDPRRVRDLRRRFGSRAEVVHADLLTYRPATVGHHIVSNVPFHLTTPLLRKLLDADDWSSAILLLQWEVARKRAGVGGATMLTALWWPWYEFHLAGRVAATAFRPVPAVDGGVLIMRRRAAPLVAVAERAAYQRLVRSVFTGRGTGLRGILTRLAPPPSINRWLRAEGLTGGELPRRLTAEHWVSLYHEFESTPATGAPARRRPNRNPRSPRAKAHD